MPNTEDKIGALWVKTSSRGDYFTGTIGDQRVVIFANQYKLEEKHPDWIVYRPKPKDAA